MCHSIIWYHALCLHPHPLSSSLVFCPGAMIYGQDCLPFQDVIYLPMVGRCHSCKDQKRRCQAIKRKRQIENEWLDAELNGEFWEHEWERDHVSVQSQGFEEPEAYHGLGIDFACPEVDIELESTVASPVMECSGQRSQHQDSPTMMSPDPHMEKNCDQTAWISPSKKAHRRSWIPVPVNRAQRQRGTATPGSTPQLTADESDVESSVDEMDLFDRITF
ncbi:hypothetical protein NUU61_009817 [Penicillium alfredii]|uniref:Uncharacterized protein n=1 Tax=Penicillium alfredii TaxID=1506179 RepID=A0A9W9JTU5_9EURO|nr:uncharacterized protein NUU61_009817 [Penicillium alfredii]KAJ5081553.1 hypothetical protein NUU61_009817 [Penicillium alfredii]